MGDGGGTSGASKKNSVWVQLIDVLHLNSLVIMNLCIGSIIANDHCSTKLNTQLSSKNHHVQAKVVNKKKQSNGFIRVRPSKNSALDTTNLHMNHKLHCDDSLVDNNNEKMMRAQMNCR